MNLIPAVPPGRLIQTYAAHAYEVLSLAVASDNARFASAGGDRAVLLWDVATAKTLRRFSGAAAGQGHSARVNAVVFAGADDALVVSGGLDTSVRVWDSRSGGSGSSSGGGGRPVQVLGEARDAVTALAVRDAEIVAGSVDGRVRTYDVRAGRMVTDVIGASVTSLCLTRDGRGLLVGSLDNRVRLMDRESGTCLKTYADAAWRNEELRVQSLLGGKERFVVAGDEMPATAGGSNGGSTSPAGAETGPNGRLWAWDLMTGKVVARVPVPWGPPSSDQRKRVGSDGREKERKNVISCLAWREGGFGDQFCVGGTSGTVTVFGSR